MLETPYTFGLFATLGAFSALFFLVTCGCLLVWGGLYLWKWWDERRIKSIVAKCLRVKK